MKKKRGALQALLGTMNILGSINIKALPNEALFYVCVRILSPSLLFLLQGRRENAFS